MEKDENKNNKKWMLGVSLLLISGLFTDRKDVHHVYHV